MPSASIFNPVRTSSVVQNQWLHYTQDIRKNRGQRSYYILNRLIYCSCVTLLYKRFSDFVFKCIHVFPRHTGYKVVSLIQTYLIISEKIHYRHKSQEETISIQKELIFSLACDIKSFRERNVLALKAYWLATSLTKIQTLLHFVEREDIP